MSLHRVSGSLANLLEEHSLDILFHQEVFEHPVREFWTKVGFRVFCSENFPGHKRLAGAFSRALATSESLMFNARAISVDLVAESGRLVQLLSAHLDSTNKKPEFIASISRD